jgi:hypothetical protein
MMPPRFCGTFVYTKLLEVQKKSGEKEVMNASKNPFCNPTVLIF